MKLVKVRVVFPGSGINFIFVTCGRNLYSNIENKNLFKNENTKKYTVRAKMKVNF